MKCFCVYNKKLYTVVELTKVRAFTPIYIDLSILYSMALTHYIVCTIVCSHYHHMTAACLLCSDTQHK